MENKLMMRLIVGTEAMFFLSLIMAYVYFSFLPGYKPQQTDSLDIRATSIFSVLLFLSSFTYWRAESNFKRGSVGRVKLWLSFTIILGIVFLFGQAREYSQLFHEHISISSSLFGTGFFTLTGFHGLHVLVGIIIISIVTGLIFTGDYNRPSTGEESSTRGGAHSNRSSVLATVGIYWHFVDLVWLVVFLVVYVLPYLHKHF